MLKDFVLLRDDVIFRDSATPILEKKFFDGLCGCQLEFSIVVAMDLPNE